ncbi:hypothetical protein BGY98DRAFT_984346 [Russula aff. rugulosa BPL654]|nr:hypothetical protein BGY98DRAFT_984346 [Russula aff. rugulosa BPL654]
MADNLVRLTGTHSKPHLRYRAAATTGTHLLSHGMHIFRLHAYEILLLHIVLSLAFKIGCRYHVYLIPYDDYML